MSSLLAGKNVSLRLLAFVTAMLVALLMALITFIATKDVKDAGLITLGAFVVVFALYYYTVERFVYRKIKLIYKFIYQTKATKREEFFYSNILPQKSIEEVSADVQQWAKQKRDEVESLQMNEEFRKEFLMNLSHELRTPIFTIQGYVETLLNGAIDDAAVSKKFLSNAAKSIDRLVRLVDDVDEISKLESGRMPLTPEAFVIQDLAKDIFEEFSLKTQSRHMKLEFKKGTEGALKVFADKGKIRQALVNLIENAIKYGNEGGTVSVGFYQLDDNRVYVEVSDDGPGIAEEHLPRIFERFYRADRSRNSAIGGTGLGLAIVKHIIDAHGQTINVRSKLGVGSSFGFTLERRG
ncbi:sensor histidine kinase [Rurimicrobium arvi]|uniref:histidine kinase n=1 Tax=Rurimicrobium arvi TaxID=2049916 RepID=A0ABP8MDT9_9BACT